MRSSNADVNAVSLATWNEESNSEGRWRQYSYTDIIGRYHSGADSALQDAVSKPDIHRSDSGKEAGCVCGYSTSYGDGGTPTGYSAASDGIGAIAEG